MADTAAVAAPRRSGWRTFLRWVIALALFFFALAFVAYYVLVVYPAGHIPALEQVDGTVYLDQGWGTTQDSPQRQAYYYTPQGTSMPQGALVTPLAALRPRRVNRSCQRSSTHETPV